MVTSAPAVPSRYPDPVYSAKQQQRKKPRNTFAFVWETFLPAFLASVKLPSVQLYSVSCIILYIFINKDLLFLDFLWRSLTVGCISKPGVGDDHACGVRIQTV